MRTYIALSFLIIIFPFCSEKSEEKNLLTKSKHGKGNLFLDSIMSLSNFYKYEIDGELQGGEVLTHVSAEKMVNDFFEKKGYLIKRKNDANLIDNERNVCVYDTFYYLELNHNLFLDAIVTYKLYPQINGNCSSNYKALIMDTNEGYRIMSENFLPINFMIDSVDFGLHGPPLIYGFDYDCTQNRIRKKFRIKIENTPNIVKNKLG